MLSTAEWLQLGLEHQQHRRPAEGERTQREVLAREDTPCYPTMRLFRQNPQGHWQGGDSESGAGPA